MTPTLFSQSKKNNFKTRKKEDEEGVPGWMLTYGDLVQQLLAFFIMLVAVMSEYNKGALEEILRQAFGVKKTAEWTPRRGNPKKEGRSEVDIIPVQQGVNIRTLKTHFGMLITIEADTFFDEGSYELKDHIKKALKKITDEFFKDLNLVIQITGHTAANRKDSIDGDFDLLGYKRAKTVADFFVGPDIRHPIVEPKRLEIITMGRKKPVADNFDPQKRKKNRRVEILLTNRVLTK